MHQRRLRPFFSFFGSKWRIAKKYPKPLYTKIIGAFAGSAGYELLYASADVRLIEIDPVIAGVWKYLIRTTAPEIRSLPVLQEGQRVEDLSGVTEEAKWLIGFWLNKGTTHPCSQPSAWMREPRYARQFWGPEIRERIASQVGRISHWRVQQDSFDGAPNVEATWFIDPPYEQAGRAYAFGSAAISYSCLADWCIERRGQAIVCEGGRAEWLPFGRLCTAKAMHGSKRTGVSDELIWTNTYHRKEHLA